MKHPFSPFTTHEELAHGRRSVLWHLLVVVAAIGLAVVARRTVGDPALVRMYVVAAGMFLVAALGPAIRWSNTGDLEAVSPAD